MNCLVFNEKNNQLLKMFEPEILFAESVFKNNILETHWGIFPHESNLYICPFVVSMKIYMKCESQLVINLFSARKRIKSPQMRLVLLLYKIHHYSLLLEVVL